MGVRVENEKEEIVRGGETKKERENEMGERAVKLDQLKKGGLKREAEG